MTTVFVVIVTQAKLERGGFVELNLVKKLCNSIGSFAWGGWETS